MGASDLFSSPASLRVFLFCFVAFAAIPHHAFAGITRHYKFDVRLFIYLYIYIHTHIVSTSVSCLVTDFDFDFFFQIKLQNVTRLCHTKSIVTVNGQFPGPRIVAREGDQVLIKVVNHVKNNISIHW